MSIKKILVLFLIVTIFCSITVVSAGWFDFLTGPEEVEEEEEEISLDDFLINSSTVITYTPLTKSDTYAWYTKDTGEYVGDAYYGPWSVNMTINLDIEKMYKYHKENREELENYTLEEFKMDMMKEQEEDNYVGAVMEFEIVNGNGTSYSPISGTTVTYIDNESNILTLNYDYADDDYDTSMKSSDRDAIENANYCNCEIVYVIHTDYFDKIGSDTNFDWFEETLHYDNLPVKVIEY